MQPLFDLLPVILFFVTYRFTDIFVATGVLIVAVVVQTSIQYVRHRKVSPVALISAALVLIFGGLTLLIHDKTFIQWKVTVLNWLLAGGLLASHFFGDQPLTQRLMGEQITAERAVWVEADAGGGRVRRPGWRRMQGALRGRILKAPVSLDRRLSGRKVPRVRLNPRSALVDGPPPGGSASACGAARGAS